MAARIRVMIVEPSTILRRGLLNVLGSIDVLSLELLEVDKIDVLYARLEAERPDLLLVNPMYLGAIRVEELRERVELSNLKVVALQVNLSDASFLKGYDSVIYLYDTLVQIQDKLESIVKSIDEPEKATLSAREQEIIAQIARGLSNKEIADKLFLSTHTVTTHRRNIMNKLQIHSPAGLTIYAIVNNIVDVSEIKD